ncbi:DNA repair protein MmcB-related protein [Oleomonas cavernae]|uniref:DNA repair protein MmcB-related protein n=1 Tax=Oleomonas cavernae TaxID=2320859 RepID=A0A418WGJ4_9PROT|nr:MmcB family DNA repair protein [Oleomonas cavernae]RJF89092.1 DNA repair protein MmcB-related protein [Oleomonas cavernae]
MVLPDDSIPFDQAFQGADAVARGTIRLFAELGFASIREFVLGSGRRADVAALDAGGRLVIVEIKVSLADFRADRKWPEYLGYCDALYFAIPPDLPRAPFEALPDEIGLIVADRFGAAVVREAQWGKLNASRRRAETLRFALVAALRLSRRDDPTWTGESPLD